MNKKAFFFPLLFINQEKNNFKLQKRKLMTEKQTAPFPLTLVPMRVRWVISLRREDTQTKYIYLRLCHGNKGHYHKNL